MKGPDSYYTPEFLAEKLVGYVSGKHIRSVADFCVGDGVLLRAMSNCYKDVKFYGTDISKWVIDELIRKQPTWSLDVCDFRNDDSIEKVEFLRNQLFDLVLLNPPFTCKGSIVETFIFEGVEFKMSTAMLFLVRALRFLSEQGGLYAILPISCIYSQKDRVIWGYLKEKHNACVLEEPDRVRFTNKCAPNVVLVYVGKYHIDGIQEKQELSFRELPVVNVVRGSVRMQNLVECDDKTAVRLIHTTNIQKGKLVNLIRIGRSQAMRVKNNGVVIPRVCNPNKYKVALLSGKYSYYLSDCVIALLTNEYTEAIAVRKYIVENWNVFSMIYKGTGAQYTTTERVKELLGLL